MRNRPLGSTGLSCSELGLGTWGLSGDAYGPVSPDEQDRVIARAQALGVTLFETADVYAGGAMQERLVRILGDDQRICIVTKIGTRLDATPNRKCFEPGFLYGRLCALNAALQPRTPDVVLLHNPSVDTLARGAATGWMQQHAKQGYFKTWGVSAGSAEVAAAAIDAGAPVVEIAFNMLWAADYLAIEKRVAEAGTGLLARSVFAHGLLCGFWSPDRSFPAGDHRAERWTAEGFRHRIRQLDAVRPLVKGDVTTLRAAALRWVLGHELVSSSVLGPRNCLQLDQLVREAGREPPYLPPDAMQALEARLQDVGARP